VVVIVVGPQPIGLRTMLPRSGTRRRPRKIMLVDAVATVPNTELGPVSVTVTIRLPIVGLVTANSVATPPLTMPVTARQPTLAVATSGGFSVYWSVQVPRLCVHFWMPPAVDARSSAT